MYTIQDLKPEDLEKVDIKNQDIIKQYVGSELNVKEAFQIIKETSKGFSVKDTEAEEADRLLMRIVQGKSEPLPKPIKEKQKKLSKEAIRIRQQQQASELALLELELELERQSA